MKKRKKLLSALLISTALLAGCGSTQNDTQNTSENSSEINSAVRTSATDETEASTITGRIESIETNSSTLTISTMARNNIPDGNGSGPQGGTPNNNGDAPEGNAPAGNDDTPDSPNGNAPAGNGDTPDSPNGNGDTPDFPNGNGGAPDMKENMEPETISVTVTDTTVITDESGSEITFASLSVGDMVTIETDENGNTLSISLSFQDTGMSAPGDSGVGSAPDSYTAVTEYTEDTTVSEEAFQSTGTDENAILLQTQAEVTLNNITVDRTSSGSTGGDSSSFYGIGAAVLVTDGSLNLTNSTITTDAAGGAGVFAYGNGTATVSDTTITTTQDTSGGIHVAGGGTLSASNLIVETFGESSAAVRSDRGGGTMTVDGGSYTSNGTGSPAVYCTADITVKNALLTATNSEAVCIEGLNSLSLTNCDLTGNMPEQEQNDCTWTVILYQSMSGDSEVGNSTFRMTGGSLTSQNGGLFYTTNTESTFYLSGVAITASDTNDFFLKCTGNQNQRGWGQSGANGANCSFLADNQVMVGDVLWDSISTLDFTMSNGSTLTGAFVQDESSVITAGSGYASLVIDESSSWIVTGDSVLTSLSCQGTILDTDGNTVTIIDSDGSTLVQGASQYTITVTSYEF